MATYRSDMMGRTALYRVFDADDQLLYVGISRNPNGRFANHATRKPWWRETVASIEITWLATRALAHEAEALAIRDEDPIYNISRPRVWGPA